MAMAIPFILAAAEVSATAIAITSVAFAVTGINDKINKAASNVFGEDLVKVGNIAGMVYGAWNGGFDLSDGMGEASSLADAANAESLALAGDPMEAMTQSLASNPVEPFSAMADAAGSVAPDSFMQSLQDGYINSPSAVQTAGASPPMGDGYGPAPGIAQPSSTQIQPTAAQSVASAPPPASASTAPANDFGTDAVASRAAAPNASAGARAPAAAGQQMPTQNPGESFIDWLKRVSTDKKTGEIKNSVVTLGGNVLQGLGQGYNAAKAREQYDAELKRRDEYANLGTAGWRRKG